MKKCMLRILFGLFLSVTCVLLAAGVLAPRAEAVAAPNNNIYVAKNEEAGLMGDVLLVSKGSGKYALYLPGSADAGKICFSWASSVTVTNEFDMTLASGKLSVPAPGSSMNLVVNGTDITVTTVQGSKEAKALFLETDTTLSGFYSFSQMNNSSDKSKAAAGIMAFDDVGGYYFSIKGRGNATWTSARDKKGYNITLYKDGNYDNTKGFELIEGVKAKKWSLLANYYDSSLLRNKLAYDMAVDLGVGLESVFVDLWVDGEYRGNYLMTPKNDYDAPKTGYMLEIDNYTDPQSFSISGMTGRITIKDNESNIAMSDIQTYMTNVWSAVKDETSEEYQNYLDMESWAKFYLLHEFYMSFDVMSGSQLMYRMGTGSGDKLIAGPVWDMDNSMGKTQTWSGFGLSYNQQHSPLYDYIQSIDSSAFWLQELGQHDSFMEKVYEVYDQYRYVFESVGAKMDTYKRDLEASALMNYHRWGYQSGRPKISSTGDACGCVKTSEWKHYVENLRNYAVKRADYLDSLILVGDISFARNGDTFTASLTGGNSTNLTYLWKCGTRTVTGSTFTLDETDVGKDITCTVSGSSQVNQLTKTLKAVQVGLLYAGADGGNDVKNLDLYVGLTYNELPSPTRIGYTFAGWFTKPNGVGSRVYPGTVVAKAAAHYLYAYWKPVSYTITYRLDGGVNAAENPGAYTVKDKAITLLDPVKEGYEFLGWTYEGTEVPVKAVTIPAGSTGDRVFTANWKKLETPVTPTVPVEPTEPFVPTQPTDPAETVPPTTDPAETVPPTTEPMQTTHPTEGTEPSSDGGGATQAPTLSQIPAVGTEGETDPTVMPDPQAPEHPLNIWYILIPAVVLVLLSVLLLLLKKRKKKDETA